MLHVHKGKAFAEIIWNSFGREICLLLFIHSFFSLWFHRYLIYSLACNTIQHYSFYSLNFSSFRHWVLFHLAAVYFLHVPVIVYFTEHFFTFQYYKMPQAHFEHFLPTPIISHFSKEPWLPLLENIIRNPILSVRCASLYWSFVSYFQVLSVERVREYTCVHEPVNAYISINISVCNCLHLC